MTTEVPDPYLINGTPETVAKLMRQLDGKTQNKIFVAAYWLSRGWPVTLHDPCERLDRADAPHRAELMNWPPAQPPQRGARGPYKPRAKAGPPAAP